ncbi:MAG: hypothetical protein WCW31_05490 [Patescibacteria group bacterium]|jgi:N-methylhydantoinase B/oxoprolinase/acetone carboxylase alpha subunit
MVLTRRKNKEAHHENKILFCEVMGEAMSDFKMSVTVYELNDFYYAVYSPDEKTELPSNAILSYSTTITQETGLQAFEELQAAAREEARSNGIAKVYGLD